MTSFLFCWHLFVKKKIAFVDICFIRLQEQGKDHYLFSKKSFWYLIFKEHIKSNKKLS